VVATLEAVDPDAGESFSYVLADDAGGLFEIVGNEIRVAPGAALDFETVSSHAVVVEATDAGGLSFTKPVTIAVTDVGEAPTDILVTGGSVLENSAAGTLVATLAAVDPDLADSFTFEIVDPSGLFEIVGNEVRVAAGALIDYETQTAHPVTLRVTDSSGLSHEEDLTIQVENVAPVIIGDNNANTLGGTTEEDQIFGRGGNDILFSGDGDDQLFGEAGNDTLQSSAGVDGPAPAEQPIVAAYARESVGQIIACKDVGEAVAGARHRRARQGQVLQVGAEREVDRGLDRVRTRARALQGPIERTVDHVPVVAEPTAHGVVAKAAVERVVATVAG
jgi:hypothetical protein